MNLPNKLTTLRVLMIPFFVVFLLGNFGTWSKWVALAIFIVASLTDMLDGYLARRWNETSAFGAFLDPVADKLMVAAALIILVYLDRVGALIAVIIIGTVQILGDRINDAFQGVIDGLGGGETNGLSRRRGND